MASSADPTTYNNNFCDICRHRMKQLVSVCRCAECDMWFCEDCRFTHDKIPACLSHTTVQSEGTCVDHAACQHHDSGDITEDGNSDMNGYPQFVIKSEFTTEVTVDGKEDEVRPDIRAVLMLESGVILATDWANCALKSFDVSGKFLGDYFFAKSGEDAGRIHGITAKDPKTVYVTLPSFKKIASVTVRSTGDLVRFSTVLHATKRRYFGIAHLGRTKQLIVGTTDTVDLLSYNCHLLNSISSRGFANPYNMTVESPGSVLIADTKANCLFRITAQQDVEKISLGEEYKQLRGVTVCPEGNIFFASLKSEGIGWMKDGEVMGIVLSDTVAEAVGLHYQETRKGRFVVVSQKGGTIKVFNVR